MNRNPKQVIKNARRVSKHGTGDDPRGEDGEEAYIPYDTSSHTLERLHIIRYDDTMHYPSYRYLMDIIHTEEGDGIVLVYSFMLVKIKGENLDGLIEHIAQGDAIFIQKFNAQRWARPEEGQPIIEKINIVVRNDSDELTLDKSKKPKPDSGRNDYH